MKFAIIISVLALLVAAASMGYAYTENKKNNDNFNSKIQDAVNSSMTGVKQDIATVQQNEAANQAAGRLLAMRSDIAANKNTTANVQEIVSIQTSLKSSFQNSTGTPLANWQKVNSWLTQLGLEVQAQSASAPTDLDSLVTILKNINTVQNTSSNSTGLNGTLNTDLQQLQKILGS